MQVEARQRRTRLLNGEHPGERREARGLQVGSWKAALTSNS